MSGLMHSALLKHAVDTPDTIALQGPNSNLSYAELWRAIEQAQKQIQNANVIGLLMDNSLAWAVLDLAALLAGKTIIPLPSFFSLSQIEHIVQDAVIDTVFFDAANSMIINNLSKARLKNTSSNALRIAGVDLQIINYHQTDQDSLQEVAKVCYTSGTTGAPKGVMLCKSGIEKVALSLLDRAEFSAKDCHLSALPLSILLENIAGLYTPLLVGARCIVEPLQDWRNGNKEAPVLLAGALVQHKSTTTILMPQMLQQLINSSKRGEVLFNNLRFVAVGGAIVSPDLLNDAESIGLPVYEGYGLSEAASVVALNNRQAHRPGSVGKVLAHTKIKISGNNEILVRSHAFMGYLNNKDQHPEGSYFATGDNGYIDDEGYLYITGRIKNIFINNMGRNISPEWVESRLLTQPVIKQAVVFGEARPGIVAIIFSDQTDRKNLIVDAIKHANANMPDYARIRHWLIVSKPFSVENKQLTGSGKLRRQAIWENYAPQIQKIYDNGSSATL